MIITKRLFSLLQNKHNTGYIGLYVSVGNINSNNRDANIGRLIDSVYIEIETYSDRGITTETDRARGIKMDADIAWKANLEIKIDRDIEIDITDYRQIEI